MSKGCITRVEVGSYTEKEMKKNVEQCLVFN